MSSVYLPDRSADMCINYNGQCQTNKETAPWLAVDYGIKVKVSRVILINRVDCCGDRTRNVTIQVSSTPPVSGSEMFTGGQLLGTFEGPATIGQRIEFTGGTELTGRYVVVQMDHTARANFLSLQEVTAWGEGRIFAVPRYSC